MNRKKKKVVYYNDDGQLIAQRQPGGLLFWLLYRSWLSVLLRRILTHGRANNWAKWWYTSRLSSWHIKPFIKRHKINTDEFVKPVNSFRTFNDFFIRRLHKEAHPIDKRPLSVVSPADGTAFVIPHIQESNQFYIKKHPFNLAQFIGSAELAASYYNGALCIIRLAPHDYHRFHLPVAGYLTHHGTIGGQYESVNPHAYRHCLPLLTNHRSVFEITTATGQKLLLIAVGALSVGSIVTTYNPKTNYLLKGSELGYFAFGGSTVALVSAPSTLNLHTQIVERSQQGYETAVRMGQAIGQFK